MAGESFFADGQWNFYCDLCGAKRKSSEGVRTWDNFYVCRKHKEERNPQDFLRGVADDQHVPWSRPEPADTFIQFCTLRGRNAIPGCAVPQCAEPNYVNTAGLVL